MHIHSKLFLLLLSSVLFLSCSSDSKQSSKSDVPYVVVTTNILGEAIEEILPDTFSVKVLMRPGVDPHYYKPTQGDLVSLKKANVIVSSGLFLEGKMLEIFEKLKSKKAILKASDGFDESLVIKTGDFAAGVDPHFWNDPFLFVKGIAHVSKEIQKQYPEFASDIESNTKAYLSAVGTMFVETKKMVESLPVEKRVLLTSHDAFQYLGRRYNIRVEALQGISTSTEYGIKDVTSLVDYLLQWEVSTVFTESTIPRKTMEAVVEGCRKKGKLVSIGGELFSDSLGEKDTKQGTYIGMMRHNITTFVQAILQEPTE